MSANLDLVRSIYADWQRGTSVRSRGRIPRSNLCGLAVFSVARAAQDSREWQRDPATSCTHVRMSGPRRRSSRELDDERVLVLSQLSARGKTSGLDVGQVTTSAASLFHIRDGKVTPLISYMDRADALADLGL